uniref:Carboxylic ester hydrolase n=1 Tax=Strigamia maritima TaxID=126957 RepID=T1IIA8_STRMM
MAPVLTFSTFAFSTFIFITVTATEKEPTAQLESGLKIRGSQMTTLNQRKFLSFRGIPYAEPPIGQLRFKAPVSKRWTDQTFDATQNGAICVQNNFLFIQQKQVYGQEDCLVLNVFTHNVEKPLRKVMVFIHGGAFLVGSSSFSGPKRLLDRNVVLVTINYRLGPLGFLSTMDEASPGNYGLLDQNLALKWIKSNIASFGGDPNKITLFGISAGSVSVMDHLISPLSKGLFHRAIAQSGTPLSPWAEQTDPRHWAKLLADKVGCSSSANTTEIIECLRETSVQDIIAAGNDLNNVGMLTIWGPVADGYFHSDLPSKLIQNGKIANPVPLIFGVTKDEGILFTPSVYNSFPEMSNEMIVQLLVTTLNIQPEQVTSDLVKLIKTQYFSSNDLNSKRKLLGAMTEVFSDGAFLAPNYQTVPFLLASGIKLFTYSFDYVTDHSAVKLFGLNDYEVAAHADDSFFLFDCPDLFPEDFLKPNDETENKFLDIWTSFAENGNPVEESSDGTVNWRPSQPEQIHVYHMDKVTTVRNYQLTNDWRLNFWLKTVPAVLNTHKTPKQEL